MTMATTREVKGEIDMKRVLVIAIVLVLSQSAVARSSRTKVQPPSPAVVAQAPDTFDAIAIAMAPREQLRSFVLQTLQRTTSGAIIVQKLGPEKATYVVNFETDKMVMKYGEQWTKTLAGSYRETLTPAELKDALAAVVARDQTKMMPFLARVGPVMQAKATPLLEKISAEALSNAFARPEMR